MRLLVTGGRSYDGLETVRRELARLDPMTPPFGKVPVLIHGGCRTGADSLARNVAVCERYWHEQPYCADWSRYGRAAGPIRNQKMVDESAPDLVLAFPGGRGTADLVRRARAAGIPVHEVAP